MNRLTRGAAVLGLLAGLLASCGYDDTPLPKPEAEESTASTTTSDCTTTDADLASYAPSDEIVPGGKVEEIRNRRRLVVGVSADTYKMASENPEHDNRIEGFDIEFAKAIGEAIFGSSFDVGRNLQFKVITAAQRIDYLKDNTVDLVIRNFTVNCARWEEIAFSQIYYDATQKVLVNKSLAEADFDLQDLAGLRVCAPVGSTSLTNIEDQAEKLGVDPAPITSPAANHTGCLVKFQQGEVDAITGDDTVLAGLAAQDPYAVVPEQDSLEPEPYGIGANADDIDLVKFVNAVLDDMRTGAWQAAYDKWLEPFLNVPAVQPAPYQPYRTE